MKYSQNSQNAYDRFYDYRALHPPINAHLSSLTWTLTHNILKKERRKQNKPSELLNLTFRGKDVYGKKNLNYYSNPISFSFLSMDTKKKRDNKGNITDESISKHHKTHQVHYLKPGMFLIRCLKYHRNSSASLWYKAIIREPTLNYRASTSVQQIEQLALVFRDKHISLMLTFPTLLTNKHRLLPALSKKKNPNCWHENFLLYRCPVKWS